MMMVAHLGEYTKPLNHCLNWRTVLYVHFISISFFFSLKKGVTYCVECYARSSKIRSENWPFGSAVWKPLGPSQKLFCSSAEAGSRENKGRKAGDSIDSLEKACPKGEKWGSRGQERVSCLVFR